MIEGLVFLDGKPAAGQRVLALSPDLQHLLGAAIAADDGRYAIDLPAGPEVVLVAKLQGPVLAVAARPAPHDFFFDSNSGDFATIRVEIVPPGVVPPLVDVSLTPMNLRGVPSGAEKFFRRRDAGVVDSSFFKIQLRPPALAFTLRVQRGRYRIYASRIIYARPDTRDATAPSMVASRMQADGDGEVTAAAPFAGFELDVDRDRSIRVELAILPADQLAGS
jgi:hypothetical protein